MKYAVIARCRSEFPVRLMCEILSVSPAGFYASLHRPLSERAQRNNALKLEIRAAHAQSRERYGSPKVHAQLKKNGIVCGHNRVAGLMRQDGLSAKRSRRFRVTTNSGHRKPVAQNHLARNFAVAKHPERDRVWVSDITYLPTRQGWLYLAAILDLSSRRVVGWCADTQLDQSLTLRALAAALSKRRPRAGLMHHSDRGVQYASDAYQRHLTRSAAISSMSRLGNCWDNAVAESFFATLKTELVAEARWQSRSQAHRDLFEYIEVWYNRQRLHASLGYRTPEEYEREPQATNAAA